MGHDHKMATPEGKVKAMVSQKLKMLPNTYKFMPVQSGLGASTLDYLLCIKGYFVAIETKKPGGKLTPRQEIVKKAIEDAGGIVFVVRNEDDMDKALIWIMFHCRFINAEA
jgi:hypothetical protein